MKMQYKTIGNKTVDDLGTASGGIMKSGAVRYSAAPASINTGILIHMDRIGPCSYVGDTARLAKCRHTLYLILTESISETSLFL